ncbi:peptidoglycan-binding protein [Streptomyces sp. ND04-05B]|uniref:peptidoglycan-binding protein n=1 Tax=Streptomyces sp. ND04-05B TaxID=3028693 RepID=UPI0029BCD24C|nr:peptidoglycan-binding protein [Streptomyces sp. ND04-05B]MDX3067674.1 peptidoglycan-binding protein [Streptomyces sp. ND04-05B]
MPYTLTQYVLLGVGLAASVGFLVLHRPRRFFRMVEINASWWVIIIGLIYARSLLLLGVRGAPRVRGGTSRSLSASWLPSTASSWSGSSPTSGTCGTTPRARPRLPETSSTALSGKRLTAPEGASSCPRTPMEATVSDLWMPSAERLSIGNTAPMDDGTAKAIAHITWDRNATKAKPQDLVPYANLRSCFGSNASGRQSAPHLLWDPFTGRMVQFFPANSRSLSLRDLSGGTRTNRASSVVIQVEALFFPRCRVGGKTYERLTDTPCKGWDELNAWVASWGVANSWPMGKSPTASPGSVTSGSGVSGAAGSAHSHVPENDHTDPGFSQDFIVKTEKPAFEPFPGTAFFMSGSKPALGKCSPIFTAMGKRLVAEGCGLYKEGPGSKLGQADVDSYEKFQRKLAYTGSAAKWPPGPTSWFKLKVPNV